MSNFIRDLDDEYRRERRKNGIKASNWNFKCNIPFSVDLYGDTNENYIIRKGTLTRFLYIKNGCRVYFTDADILTMLLQIDNPKTIDSLIENLERAYKNHYSEKFHIYILVRKKQSMK